MQSNINKKRRKREDSGSEFEGIDDEDYSMSLSQEKKRQKHQKSKVYFGKNERKITHLQWTIREEEKFLEFMIKNRKIFQDREERRAKKIFKLMGKFISSRSPQQCRSHHQKYEQRCDSYDNIIHFLKQKIYEDKLLQNEKPPENSDPHRSYISGQRLGLSKIEEERGQLEQPMVNLMCIKEPIKENMKQVQTFAARNELYCQILEESQKGVCVLGRRQNGDIKIILDFDKFFDL